MVNLLLTLLLSRLRCALHKMVFNGFSCGYYFTPFRYSYSLFFNMYTIVLLFNTIDHGLSFN